MCSKRQTPLASLGFASSSRLVRAVNPALRPCRHLILRSCQLRVWICFTSVGNQRYAAADGALLVRRSPFISIQNSSPTPRVASAFPPVQILWECQRPLSTGGGGKGSSRLLLGTDSSLIANDRPGTSERSSGTKVSPPVAVGRPMSVISII